MSGLLEYINPLYFFSSCLSPVGEACCFQVLQNIPLTPGERVRKIDEMFAHAIPADQKLWLRKMTKGSDLHFHLSGAIHYIQLLTWAVEKSLYYDPKSQCFYDQQQEGSQRLFIDNSRFSHPH